jgi:hypothetical protein
MYVFGRPKILTMNHTVAWLQSINHPDFFRRAGCLVGSVDLYTKEIWKSCFVVSCIGSLLLRYTYAMPFSAVYKERDHSERWVPHFEDRKETRSISFTFSRYLQHLRPQEHDPARLSVLVNVSHWNPRRLHCKRNVSRRHKPSCMIFMLTISIAC